MTADLLSDQEPFIDCVIIGVNASSTLSACIASVKNSTYPAERIRIIYVDGGSTDNTIPLARSLSGVEVIELNMDHPTPGAGRNAGWRMGNAPLVHFLDSDTEVTRDWFTRGVRAMGKEVAAVQGFRKEIYPLKNFYHWVTSLEWNGGPGETDSFGGDVLIRRSVLEKTGGYDPVLVGGEDPDLSQRIRSAGGRILQLNTIMTFHDIAMTTMGQYWKRAYRSGYAFAAVRDRLKTQPTTFWKNEYRRILVRGGGWALLTIPGLLLLMASAFGVLSALWPALAMITAGNILLFFPRIFRIRSFMRTMDLSRQQARTYAWHCCLVILPDLCGVLRYHAGKLFGRPLRNRNQQLATRGTL